MNIGLVNNVASWVGDMLRMFGLGEGIGEKYEIGWGTLTPDGEDGVNVRDYLPSWVSDELTLILCSEKKYLCPTSERYPHSGME